MIYRVLVCGDRKWSDYREIEETLLLVSSIIGQIEIIEGEAPGADTLARKAAEKNNWKVYRFPADWETYGRSAGPIRNTRMRVEGKPHLVIAFHENLDRSKGTKNMVNQALKFNIPVWVYEDGTTELMRILSRVKGLFG